MWIHAATTVALIITATGASPAPIPEGEFTATIEAVIGGDAVRVRFEDGEALVGLYGVSCYLRPWEIAQEAEAFVRGRTADNAVTVVPRTAIGGLPYAEIVLPTGEILNHLMLSEGLADLDPLTGAADEQYAELAAAAHLPPIEAAAEEIVPVAPGVPAAPEATPQPGDAPASIEAFNLRRSLRETAAFEAGLERWQAMSEEQRGALRSEIEEAAATAARRSEENLAALRAQVDTHRRALESVQSDLASMEAAALGLPVARGAGIGDTAWGPRPGFPQPADPFAWQSLVAEQRVQSEALRHATARLNAANARSGDRAGMLRQTLARFDRYDEALEAGATPTLPLLPVAVLEGAHDRDDLQFSLDAPLGRVDWHADTTQDLARFTGLILDAQDGRPVARFDSATPPHEAFLLLDGPGDFTITMETAGSIGFIVEVFAIESP